MPYWTKKRQYLESVTHDLENGLSDSINQALRATSKSMPSLPVVTVPFHSRRFPQPFVYTWPTPGR